MKKSVNKRLSDTLEVKEITSKEISKLPERYISFPDDLENALVRMEQIHEKLHKRGLVAPRPYKVTRIVYLSDTPKPHYLLAFELNKI